jgi:hypothetical protein
MVTLDLYIEHQTNNAILVFETPTSKKIWLPKSKVTFRPHDTLRHVFEISMPEWMAAEKGLI